MLSIGFGGGASASGWGCCIDALSLADKRYFFGVPRCRRWHYPLVSDGGGGAGLSATVVSPAGYGCPLQGGKDFAPPMWTCCRLRLHCEVSGLLVFCEMEDNLDVPMGCSFWAITVGGAGSVVVGDEIRGRWGFGHFFVFSCEEATDVPQRK